MTWTSAATEHATEQHCRAIILLQTVDAGGEFVMKNSSDRLKSQGLPHPPCRHANRIDVNATVSIDKLVA